MKAKVSLTRQEGELEVSQEEMEFFSKIVPKSIKDAVGVLADNVALWRFSNRIKNLRLAKEKIEMAGLTTQEVPLKTLYKIFENVEIEDDADLQNTWANLLANAATGLQIKPAYVGILKELSGSDVLVLGYIYRSLVEQNISIVDIPRAEFSTKGVGEHFGLNLAESTLMLENFTRLRITQPPSGAKLPGGKTVATFSLDTFCMTLFGFDFVRTCSWK